MVWGAIIGAGIGLASSMMAGNKADSAARRAAKEQMKLTGMRRDEEIRQTKLQQGFKRSAMAAGVAASNLQPTGTSASYLQTALKEDMRQIAWTERARDQEQVAIRSGAQGAGDALRIRGVSQALSTVISASIEEWG